MQLGFGVLRLRSRDFWDMTPRELLMASEGVFGARASTITKNTMVELMRLFPDKKGMKNDK